MFRRSLHSSRLNANAPKIWSDFTKRSPSFGIQSQAVKAAVLQGTPKTGPPSIGRRSNRLKYSSPELIDETFRVCYDFLEGKAQSVYSREIPAAKTPQELESLLVKAELDNPEVQFNFQFNDKIDNNPKIIDYTQPVYRYLGRKHWESYKQMLLMQRLETLAVIPDTLPTLVPRVDVSIKFPYSTGVNKWIEPGEILSSNVTSMEPVFKVQEFDLVDTERQLYTILIVNPDEPDLENDSFKTTLVYGLCNLRLGYNDNVIDARKFDASNVIAEYLPPVPEKNAGKQRFAVWVFRQQASLDLGSNETTRDNFDIRKFVADNKLDAVGAHVWRSVWDTNVAKVREMYGMPPGRIFSKVRR